FRKIKNININFRTELQEIVENIDYTSSEFSMNYNNFKSLSGTLLDNHAPPLTIRKNSNHIKPQWMDGEFMKSRSKRRKLEKIWRKNKTDENRKNYIEQRNVCANLSTAKQQSYYSKLVEASSNNQKSLFKIVDELLDKKKEKILPTHTDALKLANQFNDYYVEKIDKIRETIPPEDDNNVKLVTKNFDGELLNLFEPTTEEELKEIIAEFGITSPEDPIPAKVMLQPKRN
ncbi:MAG: hypothetical protein MK200_06665, partial [Nitrosopumilus sp.]|nr:hypothetical protein [Nitrosopumilus sp.]